MCDLHLFLLDLNFVKKSLIDFWWFFEKDLILELETWNFEFETWKKN